MLLLYRKRNTVAFRERILPKKYQ